jgi:hypothetical protein
MDFLKNTFFISMLAIVATVSINNSFASGNDTNQTTEDTTNQSTNIPDETNDDDYFFDCKDYDDYKNNNENDSERLDSFGFQESR